MSKTIPTGKPGYTLTKDEAVTLKPIFEAVLKSRNFRRKAAATTMVTKYLPRLEDGTDQNRHLSCDDLASSSNGQHKLYDDVLEDGCAKLGLPALTLGDLPALEELGHNVLGLGIDELKDALEAILNPPAPEPEPEPVEEVVVPELPQQVLISDATDRQILENLVLHNQRLEVMVQELGGILLRVLEKLNGEDEQ